jgi:hypothetical protein
VADDGKNIDPRYDPAFQRGYQGAPVATSVAPAPITQEHAAPASVSPGPVTSVPTAPAGDLDGATQTHPDADASDNTVPPLRDTPPPLRTNPYIYALGIMGVVFVVGGIGIELWTSYSSMSASGGYEGTPVSTMIAQNVAYVVTGPLITVGLAILAGLLFFAGVRWRSRRTKYAQ